MKILAIFLMAMIVASSNIDITMELHNRTPNNMTLIHCDFDGIITNQTNTIPSGYADIFYTSNSIINSGSCDYQLASQIVVQIIWYYNSMYNTEYYGATTDPSYRVMILIPQSAYAKILLF
jgi:hypothetical protein